MSKHTVVNVQAPGGQNDGMVVAVVLGVVAVTMVAFVAVVALAIFGMVVLGVVGMIALVGGGGVGAKRYLEYRADGQAAVEMWRLEMIERAQRAPSDEKQHRVLVELMSPPKPRVALAMRRLRQRQLSDGVGDTYAASRPQVDRTVHDVHWRR